ncbi:hypothetical protein [Limnoglobus roseus]|uniref:Uncharacterized protein n=1 Tax=Limnoglobus roseus TaxID=2598579 RepID=A0A5C1AA93_9BACT|nr:hypothetical protein [Limnoglobus roseus]QEL14946.1 hypothetical protein PX52LOC_01848 [Limnoglobus roseus]
MAAGRWGMDVGTLGTTLAAAFGAKPTPNPFQPAEAELTPEEQKLATTQAFKEMTAFFRQEAQRKRGKKKPNPTGE